MPHHATPASFQPGWRGGPGRPRRDVAVATARDVQRIARSFSEKALKVLVMVMCNAKVPPLTRIKAAEAVLNRGIGLPTQPLDITIQRLVAKKLVELNVDELRQVEAALGELAIDVTPNGSAETDATRALRRVRRRPPPPGGLVLAGASAPLWPSGKSIRL